MGDNDTERELAELTAALARCAEASGAAVVLAMLDALIDELTPNPALRTIRRVHFYRRVIEKLALTVTEEQWRK